MLKRNISRLAGNNGGGITRVVVYEDGKIARMDCIKRCQQARVSRP
jgi:hypothetical protein